MTNLLTLAAQIEQATEGQQREVLEAAFRVVVPEPALPGTEHIIWTHDNRAFANMLDAEAYESAAMMLVPDGTGHDPYWMLKAANPNNPKGCRSEIWVKDKGHPFRGRAATPALALAAACLRAVAQEREPHNA